MSLCSFSMLRLGSELHYPSFACTEDSAVWVSELKKLDSFEIFRLKRSIHGCNHWIPIRDFVYSGFIVYLEQRKKESLVYSVVWATELQLNLHKCRIYSLVRIVNRADGNSRNIHEGSMYSFPEPLGNLRVLECELTLDFLWYGCSFWQELIFPNR